MFANVCRAWPEMFYAGFMLIFTYISSRHDEDTLMNNYNFYYAIAENAGIIIDNVIAYRPGEIYMYDEELFI